MTMNLLVIGNGFDKAHELKTDYHDFLQWAYDNGHMGVRYGEHLKERIDGIATYRSLVPGFDLNLYWKNALSASSRNPDAYQPNYADVLLRKQGSWIDLENNLATCVKARMDEQGFRVLNALFSEFLLPKFEQYIAEVVNNDSTVSGSLAVSGADLVLSFNYSNTFERLYGEQSRCFKICYLNGKAQINAAHPNIVFGCDCCEDSAHGKRFVEYDKVIQRADRNTDDAYRDWIIEDINCKYQIYIVGHSLGRTDWEILRPLIIAKRNTTKIYYHSEESKKELMYNLYCMIGRESMVQRKTEFLHISKLNIERR